MPILLSDDRRFMPRFPVGATCSLSPGLGEEGDGPRHAVLGSVKDLNRQAVAVFIPSSETYGMDPSSLGTQAELRLALPVGYVRLVVTLIRHSTDVSGQHLVVFKVEKSKDRSRYREFVNSLQLESPAR